MEAASNLINLESLFDLSATLNSSEDDEFILNAALLTLMGKLRTFQAMACVPDGSERDKWEIRIFKGRQISQRNLSLNVEKMRYLSDDTVEEELLRQTGYTLCLPMRYQDEDLAMFCLGANLSNQPFSDEELQYASLVGTLTANALMNARNFRSLGKAKRGVERKNQLLTTLFEISREFTTLLDVNEIIRQLTYRLMGQLMVSRFALFTRNGNDSFEVSLNRLRISPQPKDLEAIQRVDRIINLDSEHEVDHDLRSFAEEAEADLIVPMEVQKDIKGMLVIGKKLNRQLFSDDDENFLQALANTAMAALENARLFNEELEKKRLEEELNIARQIQQGLLPDDLPTLPGFDLAARNIPTKQVGGDYYDIIQLSDEELLLAIADVSGKGTPAALLMANTQAALRALAPLQLPLPVMASRINDLLFQNTNADKFVTFFCGKLHVPSCTLTYTNAGHNPPILIRENGETQLLSDGGIILGIMETMLPYEEGRVKLGPKDLLLLYTDGVTEALDKSGNEFTEKRLLNCLQTVKDDRSSVILSEILVEVEKHSVDVSQTDDITMVLLKRTA